MSCGDIISEVIKCYMVWLILVSVENISDWPVIRTVFNCLTYLYGQDAKRTNQYIAMKQSWHIRYFWKLTLAWKSYEHRYVCVVTKTWLDPDSYIKINNYNIFRNDGHDSYGGIAVFTHKYIKSSMVQTHCPNSQIQVVYIKIRNCEDIENVIGVYCPPLSSVVTHKKERNFLCSLGCKKN